MEHAPTDVSRPTLGGTVLELMAHMSEPVNMPPPPRRPPPPKTGPVPMSTHTRSGEGYAQLNDDSMTDHLQE